ncbi:MAG: nucleotide exchange factor GrpE [Cystobacterineae bacterium]|nr:nucleotide exchange factor GrpE [Cystobacterineae bacterium]
MAPAGFRRELGLTRRRKWIASKTMDHPKKPPAPPSKVNDQRRFDTEGNLRTFSKDEFVGQQGTREDADENAVENTTEDAAQKTPPLPSEEAPQTPGEPMEMERLKDALEAARARVDALARAYQEMERDKEDFKRRLQRERERMLELEKGKTALLLIEAIDELELCLKNADASPLSVGVRMIYENLLKKLKENDVLALELEGTVFNPNVAEAIDLQMVDNPEDNMKILEVVRPGYVLKAQVIRPARVRVARYVPPAQA